MIATMHNSELLKTDTNSLLLIDMLDIRGIALAALTPVSEKSRPLLFSCWTFQEVCIFIDLCSPGWSIRN